MSEDTVSMLMISKEDGTDNMEAFLLGLLVIMLWLMSCATCAVVGFFCAVKYGKKQSAVVELTPEQESKQKKKMREDINFYTYNGKAQDGFNT